MWEIRSFRTGTNHPTSHWHWEISGGIIPEILHVPPRTSRTSHLPLVSNTTVSSSSHDCHSIILDVSDTAWMFGRNERAFLGVAGREYISENARTKLLVSPKMRLVYAACGQNCNLLVGSEGQGTDALLAGFLGSVRNLASGSTLRPGPKVSSFLGRFWSAISSGGTPSSMRQLPSILAEWKSESTVTSPTFRSRAALTSSLALQSFSSNSMTRPCGIHVSSSRLAI